MERVIDSSSSLCKCRRLRGGFWLQHCVVITASCKLLLRSSRHDLARGRHVLWRRRGRRDRGLYGDLLTCLYRHATLEFAGHPFQMAMQRSARCLAVMRGNRLHDGSMVADRLPCERLGVEMTLQASPHLGAL